METIKSFFKEIDIRLSNPLIISFLISWLLWNWKVPIALAFYDHHELLHQGYTTYIDLINDTVTCWTGLVFPIIFAIIYTIGNPWITMYVKNLQVYFETKGNDKNLEITKGSKISIDKYLSLRQALIDKEKVLEDRIAEESKTRLDLESALKDKHEAQIQLRDATIQLNEALINKSDYKSLKEIFTQPPTLEQFFTETWVCEFTVVTPTDKRKVSPGFEWFYIRGNEYIVRDRELIFSISNIQFVTTNSALKFMKKKLDEYTYTVNLFRINPDLWVGYEKWMETEIAYVRYYPKLRPPSQFPLVLPEHVFKDTSVLNDFFIAFNKERYKVLK